MSTWVCTTIPYWRALSGGRYQGSSATLFQFLLIIDCQPHPTSYRWWPSFPGRRCSCLEQSARSYHFRIFRSVPGLKLTCLTFLRPAPSPVIVQCLRSDFSCFGHYNRSCLLTYLLISQSHLISYLCICFILYLGGGSAVCMSLPIPHLSWSDKLTL